MAYRVPQKTTKKNEYFCLKCEHLGTENYVKTMSGCLIKCKAPNTCFRGEFNAKFYYCREYKSFSELTPEEKKELEDQSLDEYSRKEFSRYARQYYPKKEAERMIENFRMQSAKSG